MIKRIPTEIKCTPAYWGKPMSHFHQKSEHQIKYERNFAQERGAYSPDIVMLSLTQAILLATDGEHCPKRRDHLFLQNIYKFWSELYPWKMYTTVLVRTNTSLQERIPSPPKDYTHMVYPFKSCLKKEIWIKRYVRT